jgi:branched-subunit amino acid ABC-type transport system permease component
LRWKLLIIAPLLAALVGACACAAAARLLSNPGGAAGAALPLWAAVVALVAPIACVVYASVFVYRHTARRRTLQATATALLASMLTLAALLLGSLLAAKRAPEVLQPSPPNARRS